MSFSANVRNVLSDFVVKSPLLDPFYVKMQEVLIIS